jgi:hypothetical protein
MEKKEKPTQKWVITVYKKNEQQPQIIADNLSEAIKYVRECVLLESNKKMNHEFRVQTDQETFEPEFYYLNEEFNKTCKDLGLTIQISTINRHNDYVSRYTLLNDLRKDDIISNMKYLSNIKK